MGFHGSGWWSYLIYLKAKVTGTDAIPLIARSPTP